MSELKTLKDVQKESEDLMLVGYKEKAGIYIGGIKDIEGRLKQTAIEHIHSWKEEIKNPFTNDPEWTSWMQSRIDVFKEFFNLTEED